MKKQLFSLGFNLVLFTVLVYSMIYSNLYLNNIASSIKWFYYIVGSLSLIGDFIFAKQINDLMNDSIDSESLSNIKRKIEKIKEKKNPVLKFLTTMFFYGMIIIFSMKGIILLSVGLVFASIFGHAIADRLKKDDVKKKIEEIIFKK